MNQRKMPSWKDKSTFDKVLQIFQIVLSFIVIILAILQITGIWDGAVNVVEPLMGIVMLLLFWQYRNYNRLMSLLCLATAIFVFTVSIRIFLGLR